MTPSRQTTASRSRSRRGSSLIELVLALTLGSFLMVGTARLLNGLMAAQAGFGNRLQEDRLRSQFAAQFRADAHLATAGSVETDPNACTLTLGDGTRVRYESSPGRVTRIVGGSQDQQQARSMFREFPGVVHFRMDPDQKLIHAELTTQPRPTPGALEVTSTSSGRVDAALGLFVSGSSERTPEEQTP